MSDEEIILSRYQSPKSSKSYKRRWRLFVKELVKRENFKRLHLESLEVLCDLYEEQDRIMAMLDVTGYTYMSEGGRHGSQVRTYPEVGQLNVIRNQILNYSKMLGFIVSKDISAGEEETGEPGAPKPKSEWG